MTSPLNERSGPGDDAPEGRSQAHNKATTPLSRTDVSAARFERPSLSDVGRKLLAEPVSLTRAEYAQLRHDAECWRLLMSSPHVAELLAEWFEWDRRRTAVETSHAVAGAIDWRAVASAPTYAELARRRSIPGQLHQACVARRGEYCGGPVDWATGRPLISKEAAA
ncbi:hypothetical protein [Saccharopolyspora spinosa]|uniref:Uncharacterized protein n=1 Tax=Saccharopolyspora spinosa TaxID=60894 RepID=A0A2N3XSN2_SACSN|nr:hypothetical protein [Saccharopolyspora spinosa]PKW13659.1 hypothetical protein A8926_1207 [Saccharopolyspora spinosa]